jgi:hypothetical protein
MFKPRPQSPESRIEDPRVTRLTKVTIAVGILSAATEKMPSREAFAMSAAPTAFEQPYANEPVVDSPMTQEALIERARVTADKAYGAHGAYLHPAEDVTPDFIDAQNMLHRQEGATIVPFPQQLVDNNPTLKRVA